MPAFAITALFALAAAAAVLALLDSAIKARAAHAMLRREGAWPPVRFEVLADPREVRLRAAARRSGAVILPRRTQAPRLQPVLVRGAA